MRKIIKRIFRMIEVGGWLDASAKRDEARDMARGWIRPQANDF